MKIGGKEVTPNEGILVLPRSNGEDIVIRAKAVSINEDFNKMVPEPTAPLIQKKDGKFHDYSDKNYKDSMKHRGELKFSYMVIRSLEPSEIEWQTVDIEKPNTWRGWSKELMDAGISETECNRIIGAVMVANSLDELKIKEAREAFLRGQGAA